MINILNMNAQEIAEIIEEKKKLIFDDVKPQVRKELVTDYCLSVTRTKDKKWRVGLDKPISPKQTAVKNKISDMPPPVKKMKKSSYNGKAEIEKLFQHGKPYCNGNHGPVSVDYQPGNKVIDDLLNRNGVYVIDKFAIRKFTPELIKYCKENGYFVAQNPNYTFGCGHDDCHYCYECRHNIPSIDSHDIYISKTELPGFKERREL